MERRNRKPLNFPVRILLALIAGFAVAMAYMALRIYFGYSYAYGAQAPACTVTALGIDIYHIVRTADGYAGSGIGPNMGVVCGICMAAAALLAALIGKLRRRAGR